MWHTQYSEPRREMKSHCLQVLWAEMGAVALSKTSQAEKDKTFMFPSVCDPQQNQPEHRLVISK